MVENPIEEVPSVEQPGSELQQNYQYSEENAGKVYDYEAALPIYALSFSNR